MITKHPIYGYQDICDSCKTNPMTDYELGLCNDCQDAPMQCKCGHSQYVHRHAEDQCGNCECHQFRVAE